MQDTVVCNNWSVGRINSLSRKCVNAQERKKPQEENRKRENQMWYHRQMIIPKCPELISWSTRGTTQHQSVANAKKREKTAMIKKNAKRTFPNR